MEDNLLLRILTGEASLIEKETFFQSLRENKDEEDLYYQIKSLWLKSSMQNSKVDIDSEFDHLWDKIRKEKQNHFSIRRKIFQYAAAIMILLCFGGITGYFISINTSIIHQLSGEQRYTATKGSVSIIELAEGTKVWLNSDSKFTYRFDKKGGKRYAELSGEAYFEVTHNNEYPFTVKVGQLTVSDLGTTFNIKAYPENNFIETSLVEGKVEILNNKNKPILTLNPGESAMYYKIDKKIEIRSISNNVLSAWRDGKFVIRDQRLEDIFNEISRWYDVEFKFENENLRDFRYTGNIKKSTTALHVLKMLKLTTNFNYRIIEESDKPDVIIIY